MLSNFLKALRNLLLFDIIKLFFLCLLVYMFSWSLIAWGLSALISSYVGWVGTEGVFMHIFASMGGVMIAWFAFPFLYPILISFFDDKIAEAIERADYPQLPPAQPPFWPTVASDFLFSLKAIALNIICLPLYLFPLGGFVFYYGLNGYLLGMQFFMMTAGRRVSIAEAKIMQKKAFGSIFLIGVAISFSATIPVLNLAAPVIGIATMLHLFHELLGTNKQKIYPPEAATINL